MISTSPTFINIVNPKQINSLNQVFDAQTLNLVRNISSSRSKLTLTDLPASRDFLLQVLVEQDGVVSEPFRTDAFTLRANDKQLAASTEKDSSNSARSEVK